MTRSLSRRDTFERFHSDAVRKARSCGVYEREGFAADLEADMAVLAALVRATGTRRHVLTATAIAFGLLGIVVALAVKDAGGFIAAAPALLVLLVRRFAQPLDARRPALASDLLRRLVTAQGSPVRVRLDLRFTQARRHRVPSADVGRSEHYAVEWLALDATLADGTAVRIVRTEHLDYRHVQRRHEWRFRFDDDVTLSFIDGAYRAGSPTVPLDPARALQLPPGLELLACEAQTSRLRVAARGGARWDVGGGLAASASAPVAGAGELLGGLLAHLFALCRAHAPLLTQLPPASSTWVMPVSARFWGFVCLPPLLGALVGVGIHAFTLVVDGPLIRAPRIDNMIVEMIACGIVALVFGAMALLLFVVPRRLARKRAAA